MKTAFSKSKFSKKICTAITAAAVFFSSVNLLNTDVSAASMTTEDLQNDLGKALNFGVFTRYFTNGSDMEGNICVENADMQAHDATNSSNNYEMFNTNTVTVTFNGTAGQNITFALFTKQNDVFNIVPNTEKTLTIAAGESSASYTYTHSESLPLYQTNKYYLAKTDGAGNITDISNIKEINIFNGVSNICYIENLLSVGGNFTRESFEDLEIHLSSQETSRIESYNNGNGLIIYARDNSSIAYNTMLTIKEIGNDVSDINFDTEFTNLTNLSKSLITLQSSQNLKVINITATELYSAMNNNALYNVQVEDGQYAVLNIDADSDVFNESNPLRLAYKINGVLGQWNLLASRVLVNVYDSTNNDVFTGKAICYQNGGTMGTILMPAGIYESGPGNTNGSVIAQEVYLTAGEIHKIPFGYAPNTTFNFSLVSDSAPLYDFSFIKANQSDSTPISGAGFTLYADSNCTSALKKSTSDANGTVTFSSLASGTYYIKETTTPENFKANTTKYKLVIGASGICTLSDSSNNPVEKDASLNYVVKNILVYAPFITLNVYKTGAMDLPLGGAGFTLYYDAKCTTALGSEVFSSNQTGDVSFANLMPGTYYLKETTTPIGYKKTNEIYKVDVNNDATAITVNNSDATSGYTITNNLIPNYTFSFKKTTSDGTTPITGAGFTLYSDSACKKAIMTSSSDASGNVSFTVASGVYHMKETTVPSGYSENKTIYSVTVNNNGGITMNADITGTLSGTAGNYIIKNLTPAESTPVAAEEIMLEKQYDSTKLSTSEILSATVFTLYRTCNGTTLSDAVDSASPEWDSIRNMAVVSFVNVYAPNSGYVTYYLKETASPVTYSTSTEIYECRIDSNSNVTYRVYNSGDEFSEAFPICNNMYVYDPTNPGGNGGNSGGSSGENGGNSGGSSGGNGGNSGGSSGENGGNSGGSSGENGGSSGGSSGGNGGNNGGSSGENGGNNGGSSGENGGNNGGSSGENGGNSGGSSSENGGNSGGSSSENGGNSGGSSDENGGSNSSEENDKNDNSSGENNDDNNSSNNQNNDSDKNDVDGSTSSGDDNGSTNGENTNPPAGGNSGESSENTNDSYGTSSGNSDDNPITGVVISSASLAIMVMSGCFTLLSKKKK